MSFTGNVKEELSGVISNAQHCRVAEIAAIVSMCGNIIITETDRYIIKVYTENISVARKFCSLVKKSFKITPEVSVRNSGRAKRIKTYSVIIKKHEDSKKICLRQN